MIIKINKLYQFLFAFILLCQLYIDSYKIIIFSQIIILFFILVFEKSISLKLLHFVLPLLIVLIIPIIPTIPTLFNFYKLNFVLKDFFVLIKPLIGLVIGFQIFKKVNNLSDFIKTIIVTGFISAVIHFIILIFNGSLITGNVSQIREYGKDNFLELFALFFLSFYNFFFSDRIFKNKQVSRIIFIILFFSCILYLSRTMLVISIILFLAVYGYLKITSRTIKVVSVILLIFILLFAYLVNIKIDRNETGLMGFLYKVKMAPSEIFVTKIDRSNHAELWDRWRAYEVNRAFELIKENPSSLVFGNGYGSLINLKFKAPLSTDSKGLQYISEIHNGYIFVLYKLGIIGLIVLMAFLLNLYLRIYSDFNFVNVFISAIAVCYFFTTLTITGIYNKRDIIILILGGLLFFSSKSIKRINHEV